MSRFAGRASDTFDVKRQSRSAALAQLLLSHGASVHATDASNGFTALHIAAVHSRALLVPVLLNAGADPYARDKYGRTVLQVATATPASLRDEHETQFIVSLNSQISALRTRIVRKLNESVKGWSSDVTILVSCYVL